MKPRNNATHTYLYIYIYVRGCYAYTAVSTRLYARGYNATRLKRSEERERERSGGTQCVAAKVVGARSEGIPESGGEWRDEVV